MTDIAIDIYQGGARYLDATQTRCLCEGRYLSANCEKHVMWLAFAPNDRSLPIWRFAWWMAQAAAMMGRTNITHCQLVFYDHSNQSFYTYSADKANGVTCSYTKEFTRPGWRFVEFYVTERQELEIQKMLISQVGKPFDFWAILWLYFMPRKTTERAWFCSELALTALQRAGLALNAPSPWLMQPHRLYKYMMEDFGTCNELHFVDVKGVYTLLNPVSLTSRMKNEQMNFMY